MRAIMIMFDSLNRRCLPPYGGQVELPNFSRLEKHAVTFDRNYVGSLPCMPARRELHTGRLNFLHRGWGPLEPFDDSVPEILSRNGVHSHLSTDHYHYLEDGGATYHNRYSSWECVRGQEGDKWKGDAGRVGDEHPHMLTMDYARDTVRMMKKRKAYQDEVNRSYMREEKDFPQSRTFEDGIDFLKRNVKHDSWFLQIETFDPHEPFASPDRYQQEFFQTERWDVDWPPYAEVKEPEETVKKMRYKYMALLKMCDYNLGRILDIMDEENLWEDTLLIVNTDHGLLLGEHGWWGKSVMPDFEEITHTPLFVWDPRYKRQGERCQALTQTIDLAPTLLDFFQIPLPKDMMGKVLSGVMEKHEIGREYALFGYHGMSINITDGRYVYLRTPVANAPLAYEYTLMPTHMSGRFRPEELQDVELRAPFPFTKGCPVLRTPALSVSPKRGETMLFDLEDDPDQTRPIHDPAVEERLCRKMTKLLEENDVPDEVYTRFGLKK